MNVFISNLIMCTEMFIDKKNACIDLKIVTLKQLNPKNKRSLKSFLQQELAIHEK